MTYNSGMTDSSFQKKIEELRGVTDRLGMPIDEKIIRVVAVLNLYGIRTIQSCEGHLDHGYAYPWIDVVSDMDEQLGKELTRIYDNIENVRENKQDRESYQKVFKERDLFEIEVVKRFDTVRSLLVDFFNETRPDYENLLILEQFSTRFRIRPQGGIWQCTRDEQLKMKYLIEYQKYFDLFAKYVLSRLDV